MGRAKLNGQSGGAKINGIIDSYILQTGENVSVGDFVEFLKSISAGSRSALNSSSTNGGTCAVAINSQQVLVVYKDDASYGVAQVLTIVGATIIAGAKYVFNSYASTNQVTVTLLTSNTAIVAYDGGGYGGARTLAINGSAITVGPENVFRASCNCSYISLVVLTSTSLVAIFRNDGAGCMGSAYVLTISGTTITYAGGVNFSGVQASYISAVALSPTSIFVVFKDDNNNRMRSIVLTINGSTITPGTILNTMLPSPAYFSVVALSSTKVLIVFVDNGGYVKAFIQNISGTTITSCGAVSFGGVANSYTKAILVSATSVLVLYCNNTLSLGTSMILKIAGNNILLGDPIIFNSDGYAIQNISVGLLPSTLICPIMYVTCNATYYAYSQVLLLAKTAKKSANIMSINGVTKTKGSAGETIKAYTLAD
ncbi:hypothetical protein [Acetobacterium tundrae]|uniref:Uncharacterized protein n=1 Tax=Acetobacterium tundrae TaxID=132932 RepID=A0ABR6WIY8_9FIRM|nr:hypothetical protein [Acetobacterium tundrae]MBC3796426.1 hypothetical protein [Acetobacterium tundrae]